MDNSDKVDWGGIKGQKVKVGMEKAGPDTSEPKKKSIQHRWRKMVIRPGKDFGMEEEKKGSEDAAQLLELEKHSSDKENSDKSEPSSSGEDSCFQRGLKKKTMLRKMSENREEWKEVPISCSIWWGSLFGVQSKSTHLFEI